MKPKLLFSINILTICFILLYAVNSIAQCTNQVTHLSGSALVNGINVSVTSSGVTDSNDVYCTNTFPFFIGYNYSTSGSGNGNYTFNFSPPVNSLALNISGISNIPGSGEEIVVLYVNGIHYAIPSPGISHICDPMAVLTPSGDIAGCANCGVSGWSGTTISDTIFSLVVFDSTIQGIAAGSIFSLFICDPVISGLEDEDEMQTNFYPNPFAGNLNIETVSVKESEFILYSITSAIVLRKEFTGNTSVNTSHLPNGIYIYELVRNDRVVKRGRLIKQTW